MDLIEHIQQAIDSPEACLGTGERNTEIKIAYFALWALGWDPVKEICLGFQISRHDFKPAPKSARVSDFAVRNQQGICIIGEAKQWYIAESNWAKGRKQLLDYLSAVPAPVGFLTSGRKWLIVDSKGKTLDEFETEDASLLIERLHPHLGKGKNMKVLKNEQKWQHGLGPSRSGKSKRGPSPSKRSWNPDDYEDESIKHSLALLGDFADRHGLQKDTESFLLMRLNGKESLIEYGPHIRSAYVCCPAAALRECDIPQTLIGALQAMAADVRKGEATFEDLLVPMEKIVEYYQDR